jgi:hypothetical protein
MTETGGGTSQILAIGGFVLTSITIAFGVLIICYKCYVMRAAPNIIADASQNTVFQFTKRDIERFLAPDTISTTNSLSNGNIDLQISSSNDTSAPSSSPQKQRRHVKSRSTSESHYQRNRHYPHHTTHKPQNRLYLYQPTPERNPYVESGMHRTNSNYENAIIQVTPSFMSSFYGNSQTSTENNESSMAMDIESQTDMARNADTSNLKLEICGAGSADDRDVVATESGENSSNNIYDLNTSDKIRLDLASSAFRNKTIQKRREFFGSKLDLEALIAESEGDFSREYADAPATDDRGRKTPKNRDRKTDKKRSEKKLTIHEVLPTTPKAEEPIDELLHLYLIHH